MDEDERALSRLVAGWDVVRKEAKQRDITLSALLQSVHPVEAVARSWHGGATVWLQADYVFHVGMLDEPRRKRALEQIIGELLGVKALVWVRAPRASGVLKADAFADEASYLQAQQNMLALQRASASDIVASTRPSKGGVVSAKQRTTVSAALEARREQQDGSAVSLSNSRGANLAMYLAGRISKDDWRQKLVPALRNRVIEDAILTPAHKHERAALLPWPVSSRAIFGLIDYVGPYFVSCDHGCYHRPHGHGTGADAVGGCAGPSFLLEDRNKFTGRSDEAELNLWRAQVWGHCREAIERADIVFAWFDDLEAYGTLAEVGYAVGIGKRVWVACDWHTEQLWLVQQMAEHVCTGVRSPDLALASMLLQYGW